MKRAVTISVNGVSHTAEVEPRTLLVHFLREHLNLTGTHVGCDTSNCGACTVWLDGLAVKSCTVLAVQADGAEVTTIEGIAANGDLHPVQRAFHEQHGLQCGYCTPGMVMTGDQAARGEPQPDRRRDPARARGQPVPLHRLREHRRRRADGGGGDGVMAVATEQSKGIGQAVHRKEDKKLLTGKGRYVDDLKLPGMQHMAVVRSTYAHADITGDRHLAGRRRCPA